MLLGEAGVSKEGRSSSSSTCYQARNWHLLLTLPHHQLHAVTSPTNSIPKQLSKPPPHSVPASGLALLYNVTTVISLEIVYRAASLSRLQSSYERTQSTVSHTAGADLPMSLVEAAPCLAKGKGLLPGVLNPLSP